MKLKTHPEGFHLDERSTGLVRAAKAHHVSRWISSAGHINQRTFCPVTIQGRDLLADVVTGSLYEPREYGKCLSSAQMFLVPAPTQRPGPKRRAKGCSREQILSGFANDRMRGLAA